VLATTVLVILLGAGGMLAFEPSTEVNGGFTGYADALWWTAMLVSKKHLRLAHLAVPERVQQHRAVPDELPLDWLGVSS
jgi:hypothetical protein